MPGLRVTFGASTAAELLVTLAAVADPQWRDAFAAAEEETRRAVDGAGRAYVRRVAAFGRFGFLNLLGVLPETRPPHSAASLLDWARRTPARDVHLAVAGGRRRQVRELVPDVAAALAGDPAARRALRSALTSDSTVVSATRWVLATPPDEVRDALVEVLSTWRRLRPDEKALRTLLAGEAAARAAESRGRSGVETIRAVAGGLTYDPPSAPRTALLLPVPSVRPIVVVVDDVATHVLAYAPAAPLDPRDRLLALARSLGDDTRLNILERLRDGERTAPDLAAAVGAPRTTLLHHLAMLRAAGLLTTSVGPNNATYYAFRPAALGDLRDVVSKIFDT